VHVYIYVSVYMYLSICIYLFVRLFNNIGRVAAVDDATIRPGERAQATGIYIDMYVYIYIMCVYIHVDRMIDK